MTTVLLLHDAVSVNAPPDELDTLLQVSQIEAALGRLGYITVRRVFDGDFLALENYIQNSSIDVVYNLVETYYGSRFLHLIPLFCEHLGIAVTGGNSESLFLTSDKLLAKRLMVLAGTPTPPWITRENSGSWSEFLGERVICKPRGEEASVGINDDSVMICDTESSLATVLNHAARHHLLVEKFIDGRECSAAILVSEGVPEVLPIAEMLFTDFPPDKPKIVGYEAKWNELSFAYQHTVRSYAIEKSEKALIQELRAIALDCWRLFGQSGYTRVDFRIDEAGHVFVLELNLNPCLAQDSGFVAAGLESGYSYDALIEGIVKEALYERIKLS